jgi:sulfur carrier protein
MKLIVNGSALEVEADSLAAALAALDYGDAIVATAVNGAFVPAAARAERRLSDGDRIEIVAPRQGG